MQYLPVVSDRVVVSGAAGGLLFLPETRNVSLDD